MCRSGGGECSCANSDFSFEFNHLETFSLLMLPFNDQTSIDYCTRDYSNGPVVTAAPVPAPTQPPAILGGSTTILPELTTLGDDVGFSLGMDLAIYLAVVGACLVSGFWVAVGLESTASALASCR